ncbi:hypothetical protein [Streptomyces griseoluteus]
MTTNTSTWQASAEGGQERLDRWRRMLAGAPAVASRRRQRLQNPETNVATGVWLHTAARAETGRELSEWEQSFLAPLVGVLGQGEVWAVGQAYREQRDAGTVALVPQTVVRRDLDEPFTPEEVAARIRAVGELAAGQPNVAWVNRTRLLAGEQLETDAFSDAADAYGYGLTLFNGAQFGTAMQEQTDGSAPVDGSASNTPFRAKLEWAGFRCRQAAGDQWGGDDEIYWTAACQSHNYKFHTRTSETRSVSGNNDYPIYGEHGTGRMAFFDASFTGNLSALMITCWEADQSNAEWYTALGKALGDAVDALNLVDFALNFVLGPSSARRTAWSPPDHRRPGNNLRDPDRIDGVDGNEGDDLDRAGGGQREVAQVGIADRDDHVLGELVALADLGLTDLAALQAQPLSAVRRVDTSGGLADQPATVLLTVATTAGRSSGLALWLPQGTPSTPRYSPVCPTAAGSPRTPQPPPSKPHTTSCSQAETPGSTPHQRSHRGPPRRPVGRRHLIAGVAISACCRPARGNW